MSNLSFRGAVGTGLVIGLATLVQAAASQDAGVSVPLALPGSPPSTQPSVSLIDHVRALIDGSLDVSVAPQSLFDVVLTDEAALHVEAVRVRALLSAVEVTALRTEPNSVSSPKAVSSPGPDAGSLQADIAALDPELWHRRLDLDRARLGFYDLGREQRAQILGTHAARQAASQPPEDDAARLNREAEMERAHALEAARQARSEAERMVSEELARLIAVETRVRGVREVFDRSRQAMAQRRDVVFGWQRRVGDAKTSGSSNSDATYDALRRALRESRDDLASALAALTSDGSDVPALGPDPLNSIPADVPTESTRQRRVVVERELSTARRDEDALREERASSLLDEIDILNRERLGLLPSLSPAKRDAITGFTSTGWDQARSEARHLALILRYHQHVARTWLGGLRRGTSAALSPWRTTAVAIPLLVVVVCFIWGRRRSRALLELGLASNARTDMGASSSLGRRALELLVKIHRPLERAIFFSCVFWLFPSDARSLLEVQLIASAVGWTLAGSLIVNTIDAFAAGSSTELVAQDEGRLGKLRLRSLRLVGRTVVVFTLILGLCARVVGEGTIYRWVFSTCWFAALPLFLLLVRWWRATAFERLDRLRKKTPLQVWILTNRSGWKSFAAAMIGASQLFATAAVKLVRSWGSNFDLARRAHAYFFKLELERIGEGHAHSELVALPASAMEALHPERSFAQWLACPSDGLRDGLIERAGARRGGLIAAVGSRGMGKSSLLRSIAQHVPDASIVSCEPKTSRIEFQASVEGSPSIVLIDDAHRLVEARIGGLTRFDELIAYARAHSEASTWVFAISASVWPLLKRARDARPMFDETHILTPWKEGQLGVLLAERSQAAGISPNFGDLIEKLPPGSDEIDRQDALNAKRVGYERMLWDHVGGNPGLALQAWRVSLGQDKANEVHVRPLLIPDLTKLERLPDNSLFVLRAVLQLAPTTVEAVAQATRLRPDEVLQDIRFGKAQGFYDERSGGICVAWGWLRAVSRLLERRHLLVSL